MTLEQITGFSSYVKPELNGLNLPPRRVLLQQFEENKGWWTVECPTLPGCISEGQTPEDALANIKEAMELWLEVALEAGQAIPASGSH
jgi:predicted RNase H-like HicB family nuclease